MTAARTASLTTLAMLLLCALVAPAQATDLSFSVGNVSAAATSTGHVVAFWVFGVLAVLGAIATISRRNLVSACLCLVFTLCCTAGLYLILHATFLAAIQVLVYAGAVMVLFLFVVMMVGSGQRPRLRFPRGALVRLLAVVAVGALVERLIRATVLTRTAGQDLVADSFGSVRSVGELLFRDYLFAFEAVSVLLLVAIVGAVMVTREVADPSEQEVEQP